MVKKKKTKLASKLNSHELKASDGNSYQRSCPVGTI